MSAGYVYVLSNPSIPGQLKLGRSIHGGAKRAKELCTTGMPTPFVLEFEIFCGNSAWLEVTAHEALKEFRVSGNREFFAVAVPVAVEVIMQAASKYFGYIATKQFIPADIYENWEHTFSDFQKILIDNRYEQVSEEQYHEIVASCLTSTYSLYEHYRSTPRLGAKLLPTKKLSTEGGKEALKGLIRMLEEK